MSVFIRGCQKSRFFESVVAILQVWGSREQNYSIPHLLKGGLVWQI